MSDHSARPLAGHTALVTGGSRGIGAACAAVLARQGADLVLLGRTRETLERHAAALETAQVAITVITADAADPDALSDALEPAPQADILINNVGGTVSAPSHRVTLDAWNRTLAVNLTAGFVTTRAVLPRMKESGWGRIVNVASTAGLKGYPYVVPYCAAKHGVVGMTRALAVELAETGITVNAVCPGFADTDMTRESVDRIHSATGMSADRAYEKLTAMNPQGRLVKPEEVASAVAWFCSPSAASTTGQALAVAGGEI